MFIANDVKQEHAELAQRMIKYLATQFGATRISLHYAVANPDAHHQGEEITFHIEWAVDSNLADLRSRNDQFTEDHPVV
jgi:hypothetical protein